jgi:hypothetical protein
MEPDLEPNLDEFLLARIAEDKRIAVDAALAIGHEAWDADELTQGLPLPMAAQHAARPDFPLPPRDQHQLAALTLALLALPYAAHHDYRQEWRP